MATIKNNIDAISSDTETFVKDYTKLFMLKLSEKFTLILGIVMTVIVISILLLIVVVFCSFTFADYMNNILNSSYLKLIIVLGIYLLTILLLIIKLIKSKKPLLTILFVKFIVFILDIEMKQTASIKDLRLEKEIIHDKLDSDKVKLNADFQMLRISFLENIFSGFFDIFKSKKKKTDSSDED